MEMKKTLTIAGSEPSGGAGIQKDLAVFAELGAGGLSAVTAQKAGREYSGQAGYGPTTYHSQTTNP